MVGSEDSGSGGCHIHGAAQNRRGLFERAITPSARRVFRPTRSGSIACRCGVTKNVTHVLPIFDPGFASLLNFLNQNTQFGLDFYKKC
jgi:hypothetical protein